MRPPHEIKRGQRGARPGVPRKSRSTDDEAEELYEPEHMESEISDEESMAAATAHSSYPSFASLPIDSQPLDFSHDRTLNIPTTCGKVSPPLMPKKSRSLSPPATVESEKYKKDIVKTEKVENLIKDVKKEWATTTQSSPVNGYVYN